MLQPQSIRNFTIIGHIDHGKSTLADRILERTGAIPDRLMRDQFLDRMDLERERGITIKAKTCSFSYRARDGQLYYLNLVDCPGHVDFVYEVSKSLAACEGALLIIDATQGIQAQTLANFYLAQEQRLTIIPVINKIDMEEADIARVELQIEDQLGIPKEEALKISAKLGWGIDEVLEAIVRRIPAPAGSAERPLRALIYDSFYETYKFAIPCVRVVDGILKPGMTIQMMGRGTEFTVEEVGIFTPEMKKSDALGPGSVGYLTAKIKDVREIGVGDTITERARPCDAPLPGYRPLKPMVFAGLYPTHPGNFEALRGALEKLSLNDASFSFEEEHSEALGRGFRVGFLGMLHAEIVQERLEREFKIPLVVTAPSVEYQITLKNGERLRCDNPSKFPDAGQIAEVAEPFVRLKILTPERFLGSILELLEQRRGEYREMDFLSDGRVAIHYDLPLAEIATDFYDKLKSRSQGYASMDYEPIGYRPGDLVKLNLFVNREPVDALSVIVHRDQAYSVGKALCQKLKEKIPSQMFPIPIQAAIGKRVVARETIPARHNDITGWMSGGDVTRKLKLLEKQKEGRRRLAAIGKVEIPQEAFLAVLEREI
ncbi:MAG: translation elongation factor 4 [Candidatus Bipolaricaulota bacterium]|nr:translation elongation factor 4 [Candidatus Bipolaricaulota bacterium]MCS7275345.1 translation elongation factor 4 [Candidatus Bipolaricaulota bacterium]MDW8110156.1 translation elongation factor 4 [Candidatus Bipolaricaulota bacterium]